MKSEEKLYNVLVYGNIKEQKEVLREERDSILEKLTAKVPKEVQDAAQEYIMAVEKLAGHLKEDVPLDDKAEYLITKKNLTLKMIEKCFDLVARCEGYKV